METERNAQLHLKSAKSNGLGFTWITEKEHNSNSPRLEKELLCHLWNSSQ